VADTAALAGVGDDLLKRDDMLVLVAPCVPDEYGEGADQADDDEPPDVPDEREEIGRASCRERV